jgi:hypothetical protein
MVHLLDQLSEKAFNDFITEYLVPELSTQKIHHRQRRSRSPNIYSLAQGGVRYVSAHHPEDFRGPWCSPEGVDNYVYKSICKIGK